MLIVPILLILTFFIAIINKVSVFESFADGTRASLKLMLDLIPYLVAIFMVSELFRVSGLAALLSDFLAPAFKLIGIPKELAELIILRPLSGSGALAVLEDIYATHGVDSYIANSASVIMGCSDTILYISAVYFSTSKNKKIGLAIPISIFASIVGASFTCLLMKFFY